MARGLSTGRASISGNRSEKLRNLSEPLYDLPVNSFSGNRENPHFPPDISEGKIHIWEIALDEPEIRPGYLFDEVLSEDEKERAMRLGLQEYRDRFVTARGYLRTILGRYLNTEPASIEFEYNERGKPGLPAESNPRGIMFNISHSRSLALCAVGIKGEVGIDVEYVRRVTRPEKILERFFSPGEREYFHSRPDILKDRSFMSLWTIKEAYSKAVGTGFSSGLKGLDFSSVITSSNAHARIEVLNERWTILPLDPGNDYIGALAHRGDVSEIIRFTSDSAE
jgi:4'-phosphopantetheinyl transferase